MIEWTVRTGGAIDRDLAEDEDVIQKLSIKALAFMFKNYLDIEQKDLRVNINPMFEATEVKLSFLKSFIDEDMTRKLEKLTSYGEVASPLWPTISISYHCSDWDDKAQCMAPILDKSGVPSILVEIVITFDNEDLKEILVVQQ